jgi:hypothetical protein
LVELAACVAMEQVFPSYFADRFTSYGKERSLFLITHLLTYLGCPNVWNTVAKNSSFFAVV